MKKLLSFGLFVAGLFLATAHPAQAWVNFKFSAGINMHYQSGNNCFLWGLFNNGQVPCDAFALGGFDGYPGGIPGAQPFPYFGAANTMPTLDVAKTARNTTKQTQFNTIPNWSGTNPYQPTSYPGGNSYYPPANYNLNFSNSQDVPFYWYYQR
jgi:hypothetical protein